MNLRPNEPVPPVMRTTWSLSEAGAGMMGWHIIKRPTRRHEITPIPFCAGALFARPNSTKVLADLDFFDVTMQLITAVHAVFFWPGYFSQPSSALVLEAAEQVPWIQES